MRVSELAKLHLGSFLFPFITQMLTLNVYTCSESSRRIFGHSEHISYYGSRVCTLEFLVTYSVRMQEFLNSTIIPQFSGSACAAWNYSRIHGNPISSLLLPPSQTILTQKQWLCGCRRLRRILHSAPLQFKDQDKCVFSRNIFSPLHPNLFYPHPKF